MREAIAAAKRLGRKGRAKVIAGALKRLERHDSVWREFETVQFVFEIVLSASCYAQLKRHRIATLLSQPYDPGLGISIPKHLSGRGRLRSCGTPRSAPNVFSARMRRSSGGPPSTPC